MTELWNLLNPLNEEYLIKSIFVELFLCFFSNSTYKVFLKCINKFKNQNDKNDELDGSKTYHFNKVKKGLLAKIYQIKIKQNSLNDQAELINKGSFKSFNQKIKKSIKFSPSSSFQKHVSPKIKMNSTIIKDNFSINLMDNNDDQSRIGKQRYTLNETLLNEIKDCTFNPKINLSSRKFETKLNVL